MVRLVVEKLGLTVPGRELFADVSFTVEAGAVVAIMGPSGSGKTSLLNCLSGAVVPTTGRVIVDDVAISRLGSAARSAYRLRRIGLVFQFGELLPELTVLDNVALPLRLLGLPRPAAEERARTMLARLELDDRGASHPEILSGGEIQRVGIARALVHRPALVLADEPTGSLDERNSESLMDLLIEQARDLATTVVIATHDPLVASRVDRLLRLQRGSLAEGSPPSEAVIRAAWGDAR